MPDNYKTKNMILRKKLVIAVCALGMVGSFTACKDTAKMEAEKEAAQEEMAIEAAETEQEMKMEARKTELENNSIAAVASGNAELSTLVSALKAADLVDMMASEGEYTVFAPSNNAFEKLPKKLSISELAKEENKELLTSILQYHVVKGEITSDKLVKAIEGGGGEYAFQTVGGKELTATMKGEKLILKDEKNNKVEVILGNVAAANGIVHVIDEVLIIK